MLALYHLRFFELDQSITQGERKEFSFFWDPYFSQIASLEAVPTGMLLVFYNSMSDEERRLVLDCTIRRIHHIELGEIQRIETRGFEYRIETDGNSIIVDAEEKAGTVCLGKIQPTGWLFIVELEVHKVIAAN